jgi:hypothetical protein
MTKLNREVIRSIVTLISEVNYSWSVFTHKDSLFVAVNIIIGALIILRLCVPLHIVEKNNITERLVHEIVDHSKYSPMY